MVIPSMSALLPSWIDIVEQVVHGVQCKTKARTRMLRATARVAGAMLKHERSCKGKAGALLKRGDGEGDGG